MKFFILLLINILPALEHGNDIDGLVSIRNQYVKAVSSREQNEQFIQTLQRQPRTAIIKGYFAGSHFIKASHAMAPWTKWSEFKTGKKLLEQAIHSAPNEPELRFIRLTIQANLPGFLNYSSDIKADTDFLKTALPAIRDQDLHKRITEWFRLQQ